MNHLSDMINEKNNKRIVLAGGPSTGKTSVINELNKLGYMCFEEAARDILSQYSSKGSSFKLDPIKISKEVKIPIQGGLDPKILLTNKVNLKKNIHKYLDAFKDHPYIFNLGHGVLPETDPNIMDYLVKTVKDY